MEPLTWVPSGDSICPLFGCPGFFDEVIMIGFLHCHDLGVTRDLLGDIFWEAVKWLGLPGGTKTQRSKEL